MEELIRNATIDDFKRGYAWNSRKAKLICLICGEYIGDNNRDINIHITNHGTSIERLLLLDKKYTGLTEIQKEFLTMVSNKHSDKQIAKELALAESTVRNMRFSLRERARQARAFIAVMELAEEKMQAITQHKLRGFPVKEEKRKAILPRFADLFEPNKEYTEIEVKQIIKTVYDDDAIIRRYLVDYEYLNRSNDGSVYYKNCKGEIMNNINKKELINKYKNQEIEMGIIKVYNTVTGYSLVDIAMNLYKPFESIKFKLSIGRYKLKQLQSDWDTYGEKAFKFIVVEKLKPFEPSTDKEKEDELKQFLKMYIDSKSDSLKLYK